MSTWELESYSYRLTKQANATEEVVEEAKNIVAPERGIINRVLGYLPRKVINQARDERTVLLHGIHPELDPEISPEVLSNYRSADDTRYTPNYDKLNKVFPGKNLTQIKNTIYSDPENHVLYDQYTKEGLQQALEKGKHIDELAPYIGGVGLGLGTAATGAGYLALNKILSNRAKAKEVIEDVLPEIEEVKPEKDSLIDTAKKYKYPIAGGIAAALLAHLATRKHKEEDQQYTEPMYEVQPELYKQSSLGEEIHEILSPVEEFTRQNPKLIGALALGGAGLAAGGHIVNSYLDTMGRRGGLDYADHSEANGTQFKHPYLTSIGANIGLGIAPLALTAVHPVAGTIASAGAMTANGVIQSRIGAEVARAYEQGKDPGILVDYVSKNPRMGAVVSSVLGLEPNVGVAGHILADEAIKNNTFASRHPLSSAILQSLVPIPGWGDAHRQAAAEIMKRQDNQ